MSRYPMTFRIETPDGGGEARKEKSSEPWSVSYPSGGLRWFGSSRSMQKHTATRIRVDSDYSEDTEIIFTKEGGA